MPVRRILQLGEPLLREASAQISNASEANPVLEDLRDTLHQFQLTHGFGRGISAVQIGELKRVIYIEIDGSSYCLLNPVYRGRSKETFRLWDDCFSFPALLAFVERSYWVELDYQDEKGAHLQLRAEGAFSELVQHEMDHLDGVLAIDRAIGKNSLCTREEFERRYGAR